MEGNNKSTILSGRGEWYAMVERGRRSRKHGGANGIRPEHFSASKYIGDVFSLIEKETIFVGHNLDTKEI